MSALGIHACSSYRIQYDGMALFALFTLLTEQERSISVA